MNKSVAEITKYLVNQISDCAYYLIEDLDVEKARAHYKRIMELFDFIVKASYVLDEIGLKCRLDVHNVSAILKVRGVVL
jgi:hypothetical protein